MPTPEQPQSTFERPSNREAQTNLQAFEPGSIQNKAQESLIKQITELIQDRQGNLRTTEDIVDKDTLERLLLLTTQYRELMEKGEVPRTKELEIKANLEFWNSLGIKGVEIAEADIREKIDALPEKEGYDFYLYLPKKVTISQLINKMRERYPVYAWGEDTLDQIEMPRTTKESYVVAIRHQQEPDGDSLGDKAKNAKNWERDEKKDSFITPLEYLVAELRYHQEEGQHLDEKNWTLCPGSRTADGEVPFLYFSPDSGGGVYLASSHPDNRYPVLGVRRVVSKEI
jgi:hypothetical protein